MNDAEMQAYYARDLEWERLGAGVGRVEYLRTLEVIGRTLPAPPGAVLDVGGGPGRYTDWLVDSGYTVVHRDPVAHHVEQVRHRHGDAVDAAVGDARDLDLADESIDAVLLLGPLYHLMELDERLTALREARRVVRGGGPVYAAAICRWSARLHAIVAQRLYREHPAMLDEIDGVERTGRMPPLFEGSFTGYKHTPSQLRDELEGAGFEVRSLVGVEGITFALGDLDERLADERERAILLDALRATESVPELLGANAHLLATCVADR